MTNFAGFEIEVPFGPAAGAINGPNEALLIQQLKQVIDSPAGFAMSGSFTSEVSQGNGHHGRTYYHDSATGQTVNSMGLPNVGVRQAANIYKRWAPYAADHGKPLGASVSTGKGEDPFKVLPNLVYRLFEAGAHFVEANYSCPNKITDDGGREPILGYDPDRVGEVREAILKQIGHSCFFGEKWAPPVLGKQDHLTRLIAGLSGSRGVAFISGPNTVPNWRLYDDKGRPALDVPNNLGGLSGSAIAPLSRNMASKLDRELPFGIQVVSCGGVMTGQEVFDRTHHHGITLTAGVTVYFENEVKGVSYGKTGVQIADEYLVAAEKLPEA